MALLWKSGLLTQAGEDTKELCISAIVSSTAFAVVLKASCVFFILAGARAVFKVREHHLVDLIVSLLAILCLHSI